MKLNYIFLKKTLIGFICITALYCLINFWYAVMSIPKKIGVNFQTISEVEYLSPAKKDEIQESSTGGFDYKVIGFRGGNNRSSVIVKKNNQSFVVQQGSMLENKYKLISVDAEVAIFEYEGRNYQLSTNLQLEN